MKPVIVGTAGHIDHGKTALVKALTGIDADRLEEEKRRGITIDIGFAHLELPSPSSETIRFGFVDVPGHERFVRNMLAGIGGIDLVLLIVAADEGIKPQTREHFDICRMLGISRGITVLTKSDSVGGETLEVVRMEVAEFLRGSFLDAQHSPIVAVSAKTGAGLDELKRELISAASAMPSRDVDALARLPVDRVFTMKGFGAVVTGTLVSGAIAKEEELEVFPSGKRVRVRGIQVYGSPVERSVAGERTALNLSNASVDELSRGMSLAPANTLIATSIVDVSLTLLPSAKALKDRARVHFHAYTFETVAGVKLYGATELRPGECGLARLRLADPALLLPGDRFIVRQFSPLTTIGGGMVVDALPLAKMPPKNREEFLMSLQGAEPFCILKARIGRTKNQGLTLARAVAETGCRAAKIEDQLKSALRDGEIVRAEDLFVDSKVAADFSTAAIETVTKFHRENPLVSGINKEALRESLRIQPPIFALVMAATLRVKKLEAVGEFVRIPGRGVLMKDEESESKQIIEQAFAAAGLKVPALKDVLAGLKVDKVRAQKLVTLLLRDRTLIKVSDELVFHHAALTALRKQLLAEKAKSPRIDVARFKDMTGVSRKYAIPLLEFLDRERVTRREGDARVIL